MPLHLPGRQPWHRRQTPINNTRELAESWLEQAQANGHGVGHAEGLAGALHQPLFTLGGAR
jgi:hypothetical protein